MKREQIKGWMEWKSAWQQERENWGGTEREEQGKPVALDLNFYHHDKAVTDATMATEP